MDTLYTTQQIKNLTGLGRSTVNMVALDHGLGRLLGNSRVFTEDDLSTIKRLQASGKIHPHVGRPRRPQSEPATQPDQA